jgi:hypothetical protein
MLFCSCLQEKSKSDHLVLDIQLPFPNSFDFKTVFDSIQVIPLELTENSILHNGDKMLIYKNKYYILDHKAPCIYVFDNFGHYLYNSFQKHGEGPEEYITITDFDIDDNTGEIYLLSAPSLKLMVYDEQFNYSETIKLPTELLPLSTFKKLSTDVFAFYNSDKEDDFCLKIYSRKSGEIVNRTVNIKVKEARNLSIFETHPFHEHNGCIYFANKVPDNKLYHYNTQIYDFEIFAEYIIENKEFSIDKLKKGMNKAYYRRILEEHEDYAFIINQRENESFIFAFIYYKTIIYFTMYDKKNHITKTYTNKFKKEAFLMPPDFIDDQCLYVFADPMDIEKQINETFLTESSKEAIKNINIDEDNQLIIKYYIKKI